MYNTSAAAKQHSPLCFCGGSKGPPYQRKGGIQKHFVVGTHQLWENIFATPTRQNIQGIFQSCKQQVCVDWSGGVRDYLFERLPVDARVLLEEGPVHFPTPRNHFVKDIKFDKDTPTFATSKGEIKHCDKYNVTDERVNEMMAVRWKIFKLHRQITEPECKEVPA